jgi:hypothetical protein
LQEFQTIPNCTRQRSAGSSPALRRLPKILRPCSTRRASCRCRSVPPRAGSRRTSRPAEAPVRPHVDRASDAGPRDPGLERARLWPLWSPAALVGWRGRGSLRGDAKIKVRRVNLWVIDDPLLGRVHLDCVVRLARGLVGISAPCGTTNCASATRLAVKPCALRRTAARLRGLTASRVAGRSALVPSMAQSVRRCCVVSRLIVVGLRVCQEA